MEYKRIWLHLVHHQETGHVHQQQIISLMQIDYGQWDQEMTGIVYGTWDSCLTSPPPPTAGASAYCGVQTYHFQNPAELPSSIYITVANNGPNSTYVEVESADSDPVDLLIINSATPGYALGTMTTIGGKYRNDMTWNTQVDSVDINVLWSKQSFGGNWQWSTTMYVLLLRILVHHISTCFRLYRSNSNELWSNSNYDWWKLCLSTSPALQLQQQYVYISIIC